MKKVNRGLVRLAHAKHNIKGKFQPSNTFDRYTLRKRKKAERQRKK